MKKLLKPAFRPGFAPLLVIGIVAVIVFILFVVFGPYELPGLGQLSLRQQEQRSEATEPELDPDGDGFNEKIETYLGTDPQRGCPTTEAANDEKVDAWPPDFNDNRIIQIDDVNAVSSRFNKKAVGEHRRYDLNGDGWIRIDDVYAVSSRFGQKCTYYPYKLSARVGTSTTGGSIVGFSWTPAIETTASEPIVTDQPKPVLSIIDLPLSPITANCNSPESYSTSANTVVLESGALSYSWTGGTAGHNYCAAILLAGLFYPSGYSNLLSNSVNFTIPGSISPAPSPTPIVTGDISAAPNPCTISAGDRTCTSTISWTSSNVSKAYVCTFVGDFGNVSLWAEGLLGSKEVTIISEQTHYFILRTDSSCSSSISENVLDRVKVTGISITSSPTPSQ